MLAATGVTGYPYVKGYKPRSNFQGLLQEVVERRVYARPELATTVAKLIEQPVVLTVE